MADSVERERQQFFMILQPVDFARFIEIAMKTKLTIVRDVLRFRDLGWRFSEIVKQFVCSKSTVKKYLDRAIDQNAEHVAANALSATA